MEPEYMLFTAEKLTAGYSTHAITFANEHRSNKKGYKSKQHTGVKITVQVRSRDSIIKFWAGERGNLFFQKYNEIS